MILALITSSTLVFYTLRLNGLKIIRQAFYAGSMFFPVVQPMALAESLTLNRLWIVC
jgi:hypothetical protein